MDESLVAGGERAGRERSGHKGKVSPQGPLFVSLFGRVLMPFVEHFRKPGRPLLCKKPEAGRLGPELGVAAVGGQVFKPHVYCTLALVPLVPSKFSTVTVGHLVLRLVSVLEKLTLGQGSQQVFI